MNEKQKQVQISFHLLSAASELDEIIKLDKKFNHMLTKYAHDFRRMAKEMHSKTNEKLTNAVHSSAKVP